MDHRIAEFVRFIEDHESVDDLVDEAKADTWVREQEHALLLVRSEGKSRLCMVRGGLDGILLELSPHEGIVLLRIDSVMWQVERLAWHIHPVPTGPSDQDRRVLDLLHQESSLVYEIGGSAAGTSFVRFSNRSVR